MNYTDWIRPEIGKLPVYEPGKPIELIARERGIPLEAIIKLASNENPLGPSPDAVRAMEQAARHTGQYPDNNGYSLIREISRTFGFAPGQLVLAAGSNEIFYRLADLFARPGVEVVMGRYAFISYRIAAMLGGATIVDVPMPGLRHDLDAMLEAVTEKTRLVFLPNPNNPTGTALPASELAAFARALPEWVVFCYDEAYMEYEEEALDVQALIQEGVGIIGTRTFSKIYGLAGLRIGYGYADPGLADLLNRIRPPFNTGSIAQAAAIASLADSDWTRKCREQNLLGREQLSAGLTRLGLQVSGEHGNFLLIERDDAAQICEGLLNRGIIVRPLAGYGLPRHLRITIGTENQNVRLLEALSLVLNR